MKRNRTGSCLIAVALAALPGSTPAMAGVTVDIAEVGSDVVTTASGSFDVSLWTYNRTQELHALMNPRASWLFVGTTADVDVYTTPINFAGPTDGFGTGGSIVPSSVTGDMFGVQLPPASNAIPVPTGYTSGDPLSGDATYIGETFASLGAIEGTYTWTWDTADGQGDFFTINVGPIPAPGTPGVIALLGLAGLVGKRRRRNG